MAQYQIGVIVGSLRKDSYNGKLANALTKMAPSDCTLKRIQIGDLPLYNQDDDNNQAETVKRLKAEIKESHGIIMITPEYNRGMPGVLKNAIDHGSRPYGQNAWKAKPVGILGMSPGAIGTALAQNQLRCICGYLDMPTMGQPEAYLQYKDGFFDAEGNIAEASKPFVQKWLDTYVAWLKSFMT